MQTKNDIQQLLAAAGTTPNKRLGQNFLIDLNLMRLIVDSANIGPEDVVLEVGCGTGSLTQALATRAAAVVVAEYDTNLAPIAQAQVGNAPHVQIFNTDILENKHTLCQPVLSALAQARQRHTGRFLLVANLPYHVACPVMLNVVVQPPEVDAMVVTVQKEVADRMCAPSGSRHYGTLSLLLAATGKAERLRVLKPSVFWPPPQIDSAIVHYQRDPHRVAQIRNMSILVETVDLFMQHRRKMLKAAAKKAQGHLVQCDWRLIFEHAAVDPSRRPEQIPPEAFVRLANTITASLPAPRDSAVSSPSTYQAKDCKKLRQETATNKKTK